MAPLLSSEGPIPGGYRSLHGAYRDPLERTRTLLALENAQAILQDEELQRLLSVPRELIPLERSRHVFVNRNLRLGGVEMVGFDMDYTLAIYHMRRIEQLSFDMTLAKLVGEYNYPPEIGLIHYDHDFGMRGLAVDKVSGNIIKMDRFGYVGRAYHGRRTLSEEAWKKLYRGERVRVKTPQYAWIDTLFALPEACLFAGMIELLEGLGKTINYGRLYDDIREAIDIVHRDNSLKREIRKDIGHYIFKDPELGPALHKLRSGGKKLFVLTNSLFDYTDAVMGYLLDGVLPEYPTWRHYFDLVITGAAKPAFFSENRPFIELGVKPNGEATHARETTTLDRWKVYEGGNLSTFEQATGISGEKVPYVGDHIYGDILKSKKSSLWRTCMIVQEIEDEIVYARSKQEKIQFLSEIELRIVRLDDEISHRKSKLNSLDRKLERGTVTPEERLTLEEQRKTWKSELERLRRALKESSSIAEILERELEQGFNPYWGLLFKEGNENSRFGEQIEQYACIYTSRVSNFMHYSPMQYFRSPRDLMPHEQAGALTGKLSPVGSEGPPKGER